MLSPCKLVVLQHKTADGVFSVFDIIINCKMTIRISIYFSPSSPLPPTLHDSAKKYTKYIFATVVLTYEQHFSTIKLLVVSEPMQ